MTTIIIVLTSLISIAGFFNRQFFDNFLFNPNEIRYGGWHRFITHAFLHGGWMHLIVNMYVLFSFGQLVENDFNSMFGGINGEFFYLVLYFLGIVISSVPDYFKHKYNSYYNAVGASGAVAAVVFSAIVMHPMMSMYLMFLPIPVPAVFFGLAYLAYSWFMAARATDNIGHIAHFYGSVFGAVFTILTML